MGAYIHISSELSICSGQSYLLRHRFQAQSTWIDKSVSVYNYLDLLLQEPDVVNCLLQHGADVDLQQCVSGQLANSQILPATLIAISLSKGMLV